MAKKNFKGGLDSLLQNTTAVKEQSDNKLSVNKSPQEGTKIGETRATFIVREDLLEKIKAVAYWDRLLVKDVVNIALAQYLEKYGTVKPIPNKDIIK